MLKQNDNNYNNLIISPFKALAMDHRNLDSTAGVPMLTEVKQSGLKCHIFTPSRRKWLREGKKACFEKDWWQGTGEQVYRCSGAYDGSCLGNRSSLPVALNCPARQWTIISARWKWDQYLPAGVGLHRLSPYLSDCPQGLLVTARVIYCAGGKTRPLKFVKRTGQRCAPAESTH